jgi:hypothetical protein
VAIPKFDPRYFDTKRVNNKSKNMQMKAVVAAFLLKVGLVVSSTMARFQ